MCTPFALCYIHNIFLVKRETLMAPILYGSLFL
jgi:hypothetical protein